MDKHGSPKQIIDLDVEKNVLSRFYFIQQPDYPQKPHAVDLPGQAIRWKTLSLDGNPSGPCFFY
jgi:hypothetical protein